VKTCKITILRENEFLAGGNAMMTFTLSENAPISRNFHESLKIIVLTKNFLFSDEGV